MKFVIFSADGCKEKQFNCSNGSPSCIDENWKCDGDSDCSDSSDEMNCPVDNADSRESNHSFCPESGFSCASNDECIPKSWECDEMKDCVDGSDEGPRCELH